MTQLSLSFETPPLHVARAIGDVAMRRAVERADDEAPGFAARAAAVILAYLAQHHTGSGEVMTDACKSVGYCTRKKGHGTAGGRLWSLA